MGSDTHTGCLVLFQQGKVDAITGDDTILAGLAAQDPYAFVVKAPAFTSEPYGLGISKTHPSSSSSSTACWHRCARTGSGRRHTTPG